MSSSHTYSITVTNKDVFDEMFDFYQTHHLDFEQIMLGAFRFVKQCVTQPVEQINQSMMGTILAKLNTIECNMSTQTTNQQFLLARLDEFHSTCLQDLHLVVKSNNTEHFLPLLRSTAESIVDKMSLLTNDLQSKVQSNVGHDIETQVKLLQAYILQETTKLANSSGDDSSTVRYIQNANTSISNTLNILASIIDSSEKRIEQNINATSQKINTIQTEINLATADNARLFGRIDNMMTKFEKNTGSVKGAMGENVIYHIMSALYPNASVEYKGNEQKESGDVMLVRTGKPTILIETKDHDTVSVGKQDVAKFIRDCEIQNCSGIMLANKTGIANKEPYELQIHNKNVLLFVPNAKYEKDIIQTAVYIVERVKQWYDDMCINNDTVEGIHIDSNTLLCIHKEYLHNINIKHDMMKRAREHYDKTITDLNSLLFTELDTFLDKHFAKSKSSNTYLMCEYCGAKINKSKMQHYRYCSAKKIADSSSSSLSNTEINNLELDIDNTQVNKKQKKET